MHVSMCSRFLLDELLYFVMLSSVWFITLLLFGIKNPKSGIDYNNALVSGHEPLPRWGGQSARYVWPVILKDLIGWSKELTNKQTSIGIKMHSWWQNEEWNLCTIFILFHKHLLENNIIKYLNSRMQ